MALVLDTGPLSLPLEMLTMSTNGDETSSAFVANLIENNSNENFWLSSRTLSALATLGGQEIINDRHRTAIVSHMPSAQIPTTKSTRVIQLSLIKKIRQLHKDETNQVMPSTQATVSPNHAF